MLFNNNELTHIQNNSSMQKAISHFLRGLLLIVPVSATIFIIFQTISWVDGLLNIQIPGLGFVVVVLSTTFLGFLANTIFAKPLFDLLAGLLRRIPVVNFIYSSLNDVVEAVAGDKKRFTQPVLVPFDGHDTLLKPGFVTKEDLSGNNMSEYIAVYLPHSYNFSGNVFLVKKSSIIRLEGSSSEVMKFTVSGGVTGKMGSRV